MSAIAARTRVSLAREPQLPRGPAAVLRSLRFSLPDREFLAHLSDEDWREAVAYSDRTHLTLLFAHAVGEYAPAWLLSRFAGNRQANTERLERLLAVYREVAHRFDQAGIEFLVLKGFTHWPGFCPDATLRMQYDLDLYCPSGSIFLARNELLNIGYEPLRGGNSEAVDHLPTMIRKTGWEWRGDHFDVEIPHAVELHFRFWDTGTERFGPEDLEAFWLRRQRRKLGETDFTSLSKADALAYAALHALRHLLRGDIRAGHIYELAWFLEHCQEAVFWRAWRTDHDDELRRMQAICFSLAEEWFGCYMPPEVAEEIERLPTPARDWLREFTWAPIESEFHPNKQELWLHLSLLSATLDKLAVVRRRLFPLRLPGPIDAVHLPTSQLTWAVRVRRKWKYLAYLSSRASHHARVLAPTLWSGFRWSARGLLFPKGLWLFFGVAAIFNTSVFVYFLLYNLYLLDRGFSVDFLGYVTSGLTIGSLTGSILAGFLAGRLGLRKCLCVCFLGTAMVFALRTVILSKPALIGLAAAGGACLSLWAICLSPIVAHFTNERNRPAAFSFTFASGIATGVFAGLAGGRLPALLHSKQTALLVACGAMAMATLPLIWMRFETSAPIQKRAYFANPFLLRFLAALSLWSLATGSFNPFFSAYFSVALHMGVDRIGTVFAGAQLLQVISLLLSPLLFRKAGLAAGIAITQVGTAIALGCLGWAPVSLAVGCYAAYTASQYMNEPGMYTLLMSGVSADQRQGASALNFIVISGGQALAASVAGAAITRVGYPPVLFTAAILALCAALAFFLLLREPSRQ